MSSGSKPVTTIGTLYLSARGGYWAVPITLQTWPAARNPCTLQVGDSMICLLYTSPSPRDGLLSIRRQRQMCIRDSLYLSARGGYWAVPITLQTWPAARNPCTLQVGDSM